MSVAELARQSGVARESLSKVKNDTRALGPSVAAKIADALGLSVDQVRLPREADVESRRGLDRRLRSLEDDLAEALHQLARANREIARLGARVRNLEDRPWPFEGRPTGTGGNE